MTKPKKRMPLSALLSSFGGGGFYIEIKKSRVGAVMLVGGVLALGEISDTAVTVLSHSGRLFLSGERLTVSALENRTLTVYGRITGLELCYGKSARGSEGGSNDRA